MARKTVKIVDLIDSVNRRNRDSTCDDTIRAGWNSLLEEMLSVTDTYAGFRFMNADEVVDGDEQTERKHYFGGSV